MNQSPKDQSIGRMRSPCSTSDQDMASRGNISHVIDWLEGDIRPRLILFHFSATQLIKLSGITGIYLETIIAIIYTAYFIATELTRRGVTRLQQHYTLFGRFHHALYWAGRYSSNILLFLLLCVKPYITAIYNTKSLHILSWGFLTHPACQQPVSHQSPQYPPATFISFLGLVWHRFTICATLGIIVAFKYIFIYIIFAGAGFLLFTLLRFIASFLNFRDGRDGRADGGWIERRSGITGLFIGA
ncbi:hypothetical protein EX30DRAFT_364086 [Ascodesmis nigricans]|uniref:Uncharacterized protein n=1 Tax=Ascodesmis nigricans TaxID=341454 RepID=A0A4V3SIQ8_9PEZI|nr:hypothetical protein EX30DRAFT_364086 [Ascodesmis nigricans]